MDLNKVMIIGRLTRDPESRTTTGGTSVCQMGVATSYVYNNKQTGQKVEQTEFHNVVLWAKLGEIAQQYLKKGTQVFLEGRLQTRSWEGKDGAKHSRTEIVADNMIMLGKPSGSGGGAPAGGSYSPASRPSSSFAKSAEDRPKNDIVDQPSPNEELPTIQQDSGDVNVEDIPF
jgi:single-strand DNA-binding protein